MDKNKVIDNIFDVPEKVIEVCGNEIVGLPTIIETDFYRVEVIKEIISNNNLLWSNKFYDRYTIVYKQGLIKFKNDNIFIYFVKRKDENTYKFYILCEENKTDSVVFFLNKFNKII